MQSPIRETVPFGDREVSFESGEIARQAGGSVVVTAGDTVLFAAVTAAHGTSPLSYMPLTVEYRWRFSSAGRIPGSYDRRESRPSDAETLTSRLIDRGIRPFFPDGWGYDTQLFVSPMSLGPDSDLSVLAIAAASAALCLSDIPWDGPVVGVRVGLVEGKLLAFPTPTQLAASALDLVVSVRGDGIVMVEGGAREVAEDVVLEAFALARVTAAPILEVCQRLRAVGRPLRQLPVVPESEAHALLRERVRALGLEPIRAALLVDDKQARYAALAAAVENVVASLRAAAGDGGLDAKTVSAIGELLDDLKKECIRTDVIGGRRIGGRGPTDIRAISGRSGFLPRCHGSSLFTRGETQAIVTCTLGTERDARMNDTLEGRQADKFMLHYNFPPYSVGEVKPIRGPGRREIGHGNLARRALEAVLPGEAESPYTIRLESVITESNGSSSMATVCGGTLALQDAGLVLSRPVAGIAMGLVKEGDAFVVLSDILGDEDHVGDMDFKVCGTERGITAIQLDSKLGALPDAVMAQALTQARTGRLHILGEMHRIMPGPRADLSPHAPRAITVQIEPNRIGGLVGTGGKTIKAIQSDLGVNIDIGQDGLVRIFGTGADTMRKARERVNDAAGTARVGETYEGLVVGVQPFGSFVRLFEGVEGLVADAQLPLNGRVKVRVTGVNSRGKLVLEPQS